MIYFVISLQIYYFLLFVQIRRLLDEMIRFPSTRGYQKVRALMS